MIAFGQIGADSKNLISLVPQTVKKIGKQNLFAE
jgi:hypothetical protein